MASKPQTYASHRRVHPLYHLFVSPILIANIAIRTVDAAREFGAQQVCICGGVSANAELRQLAQASCDQAGLPLYIPPLSLCTDNAAMIALAGAERLQKGLISDIDTAARPRWPLDEKSALSDPTHTPGRKGAKA